MNVNKILLESGKTEADRAELLQEIERLQAKVTTLESAENRDLFLSFASHELRTPLTSIKGYGQLLQRNLRKRLALEVEGGNSILQDLLERDTRAIEAILSQTGQLAELINEMLDFSRLQTGRLELRRASHVNITELVERTVHQQAQNNSDRNFDLRIDTAPIFCSCDTARVEQVLNNLLGNAVKYSSPPNSIVIRVGLGQAGQDQEMLAGPNEAVICVQDEGKGIDLEQQPYVFDSFYRSRNPKNSEMDGLGLGLFISREIVVKHGGKMWFHSLPDVGSTFYFSLPVQ